MLAELGFIGTIGEDDEVPVEPESDSGDDQEEVGAGGRERRGKEWWAGTCCGPQTPSACRGAPSRPCHPGWAESTAAGGVGLAARPVGNTTLPSIRQVPQAVAVDWAVGM